MKLKLKVQKMKRPRTHFSQEVVIVREVEELVDTDIITGLEVVVIDDVSHVDHLIILCMIVLIKHNNEGTLVIQLELIVVSSVKALSILVMHVHKLLVIAILKM